MNVRTLQTSRRGAALALLALAAAAPGRGADAARDAGTREAAAVSAAPKGMLLRRDGPRGKPWQVVDDKETLHTGDLLLGLPGAGLTSKDGAVGVKLLTDFNSPLPILEPAVVLHSAKGADLDFRLDRGMVEVTNRKEKGPARVRLRARDAAFDLDLDAPGATVLVQLYSCWPRGTPFVKDPGPKDQPVAQMIFLVLKGQVELTYEGRHQALNAPPGPAEISWDSVTGIDPTPQRLEKLPAWALPPTDARDQERARKIEAVVAEFSKALAGGASVREEVERFAESDDPGHRKFAAIVFGATDDLAGLSKVLSEARHADLWDYGVLALRHWIGRKPGQDQELYKGLVEVRKLSPVQAETVLQFLHGFPEADLERPDTYEMLIQYLNDKALAVRGLAHWHLVRLVPAGRKIEYSPVAPPEERARAVKEWQKLIPPGKMPPKADKKEG